ncbi:MAG: DNA polymerase I [Verrucomicrobiota bacterium]
MGKRVFLLDGMALIYRAHFALIRSPIYTSGGVNSSALFGFTNTLIDLLQRHEPTHLAVAFDTSAPTKRHEIFPEYKAQRDAMPEDIADAIPNVKRLLEAFRIPVLEKDGYEADDIIGTLAKRGEAEGNDWEVFMVTPDKDFAQLVSDRIKMFKPGRRGGDEEILGAVEVCEKWGVERPEQVADILGLWGDASDNIPGIPGIGEKTAKKLVGQYGSVEGLLEHVDDLKGKQKENVTNFGEQGKLSKELATIQLDVPVDWNWGDLEIEELDEAATKNLFVEFEFNSLGKRLFGNEFKAGRGHGTAAAAGEGEGDGEAGEGGVGQELLLPDLKTIADVAHDYQLVATAKDRAALLKRLGKEKSVCFDLETSSLDAKEAIILGIAFSWKGYEGYYVAVPDDEKEGAAVLEEFREFFLDERIEKVGHNLKFDIGVLSWRGMEIAGAMFDTMLAHTLVEPDQKHTMDVLSEAYLGYTPISISALIGDKKQEGGQLSMLDVTRESVDKVAEYAAEDADVTWQLAELLRPRLKEKEQEKVFYEIECPLVTVLVNMEREGIRVDVGTLEVIGEELQTQIDGLRASIFEAAGEEFNLNSPKQLGEVLFDRLKLVDKPKKTKTGQYVTNEQVLTGLAPYHDVVADILRYREATKLKNTYVDTLPEAVYPETGRVHTTFFQLMTATGRLASANPNLQNIPIRSEQGREIRKAFVARDEGHLILSADYSQIELRVMAELSQDEAMLEAFGEGLDIHTATAARVYGTELDDVLPEMRRNAKMVNFGIIYGISAFGLSQRLGIARGEAAQIIEEYFKQYSGVKAYMERCVEEARANGYVETITGRRRYLRDIDSRNANIRSAAERTAINTPIQGTAADMIKIAMRKVAWGLEDGELKTRMILQVHDELVFDMVKEEEAAVTELVTEGMRTAIPMGVPIVVETGTGENWLQAH